MFSEGEDRVTSRAAPKAPSASRQKERRSHDRVAAKLPISANLDGKTVPILVVNLSEGGARGCSEVPFPIMTRLEVSLELPEGRKGKRPQEPLRMRAVVVRCEPHPTVGANWNLALFFVDPDPSARERLARYIRSMRDPAQDPGSLPGGDA